jgi:hypothetical protein
MIDQAKPSPIQPVTALHEQGDQGYRPTAAGWQVDLYDEAGEVVRVAA